MKTESKKTKMKKINNREQVRIAVESVRRSARCLWRMECEKKDSDIGIKE